MIIVPEREIVIITPPRTGSTSLLDACRRRWPNTMSPYRHMEADGIPFGYDRWRRVGIVRDPFERMMSVYRYLAALRPETSAWHHRMGEEARADPFTYWLLHGMTPFTNPDWIENIDFSPRQSVLHKMPEQRKSQEVYVRPDLGTEVIVLGSKACVQLWMHLDLGVILNLNQSPKRSLPMNKLERAHIEKFHSWDIDTVGKASVA